MEWKAEKMCTTKGDYDLLVERFKKEYHCEAKNESWIWRVIHSGIVLSQGTTMNLEQAQQMAESNVPLNTQ
jgi:hypothetical protein